MDNEQVPELPIIEGMVSDSNVKLWAIVHPMAVTDFWVQPSVTIREDGKWRVQIHIERPGGHDVAKPFEILAIANSIKSLKEGDKLSEWPEAQWKSQIIEVVRK